MSYAHRGYNCARIPALENYAQAKQHFESVVHIRGRDKTCKPLGKNRRFTWFTIQEKHTVLPDSGDDPLGVFSKSYAYRCYDSDLVEFFHNGDILVRNSKWHSPTTMGFLTFSLQAMGQIVSKRGKWYFRNKRGEVYPFLGDLLLRADEHGVFCPREYYKECRYRLNRKAINAMRKKYKEFIDYGKSMLLIDQTIPPRLELGRANGLKFDTFNLTPYYGWGENANKDTGNRDTLFSAMDKFMETKDLDLAYELFSYIAHGAGYYSYKTQTVVCSPAAFVKKLEEVMKYQFAKELFDAVEVEQGVMFHDDNLKYVTCSRK